MLTLIARKPWQNCYKFNAQARCVSKIQSCLIGDFTVRVEQGELRGKTAKDVRGGNYYSFQGIPYAKPPLGELRFKAPQPPESWTGVRDATTEGSECYSRHLISRSKRVGSEDCLTLNVYTSALKRNPSEGLKPVMVWIHGGGFTQGSSRTELYGPEYLVSEDVVLVTLNYRLGILGFLSLKDASLGVPGNAGLKDIVLALKWVQKNIVKFSGDPSNITIFGESAGGSAVHHLILSPAGKGLFHKAIAQSGCALNRWAWGRPNMASEFARVLDLPNVTDRDILKYLGDRKIALAVGKATRVVEKPSEDALITEEPIRIMKSGNYNHVPILMGYNDQEGMVIEVFLRHTKPELPKDFETTLPFILGLQRGSAASKDVANRIRKFYFEGNLSEDSYSNLLLLDGDNHFIRDIMFAAKHHTLTSSEPVYLYRMSLDANLNMFKKIFNLTRPGACHVDELGYLFKSDLLTHEVVPGSVEDISRQRFVKLWTNFARHGNPNAKDTDDLMGAHWKPMEKTAANFLDIGEKLCMGVNPDNERLKFWEDIFSEFNPVYSYNRE